jgi:hypothetical protein
MTHAPDGTEGGIREAARRLRNGLVAPAILVAVVVGLLLAVPGLEGVAIAVTRINGWWVAVAVAGEILSFLGYVLAFLQVFERAPIRFGARLAVSELAFNAMTQVAAHHAGVPRLDGGWRTQRPSTICTGPADLLHGVTNRAS